MMQPNPTLDQLKVFLAVVDSGGFSAAARVMGRAQSVVSYAIAQLENQLEVVLFDRTVTRPLLLTSAGTALLEDARRLIGDLDLLQARLRGLHEGLESKLTIAISSAMPLGIIVQSLHAFRERFPTVSLEVTVGTLGVVIDAVTLGKAGIGFGGMMEGSAAPISFTRIGLSSMIPVAAPDHPLAKRPVPLTPADVRDETQLVVYDASGRTEGRSFNVFSLKIWRVSDNATKLQFIKGGLGWGGLPVFLVHDEIAAGRLVALQFPAYGQAEYPLYAISNTTNPPGPAARWLMARVESAFAQGVAQ